MALAKKVLMASDGPNPSVNPSGLLVLGSLCVQLLTSACCTDRLACTLIPHMFLDPHLCTHDPDMHSMHTHSHPYLHARLTSMLIFPHPSCPSRTHTGNKPRQGPTGCAALGDAYYRAAPWGSDASLRLLGAGPCSLALPPGSSSFRAFAWG